MFHEEAALVNVPHRIELKLDLPGLPELATLVNDFASRALDLAEFSGQRRDDLLKAFRCGVELVERALAQPGDALGPLKIDLLSKNCTIVSERILLGLTARKGLSACLRNVTQWIRSLPSCVKRT